MNVSFKSEKNKAVKREKWAPPIICFVQGIVGLWPHCPFPLQPLAFTFIYLAGGVINDSAADSHSILYCHQFGMTEICGKGRRIYLIWLSWAIRKEGAYMQWLWSNCACAQAEMSFWWPHMLNKSHLLMTIHDLVLQCLGNAFLFLYFISIRVYAYRAFQHFRLSNISSFPTFESGVLRFVCIFLFFLSNFHNGVSEEA